MGARCAPAPARLRQGDGAASPVEIKISLRRVRITEVTPSAASFFEITAIIDIEWMEPRLAWDPYLFNETMTYTTDQIWTPSIYVDNNYFTRELTELPVQIDSNGRASMKQQVRSSLLCDSDLIMLPFDVHRCEVTFESTRRSEFELITSGAFLVADVDDNYEIEYFTSDSIIQGGFMDESHSVVRFKFKFSHRRSATSAHFAVLLNMAGFPPLGRRRHGQPPARHHDALCTLALRQTIEPRHVPTWLGLHVHNILFQFICVVLSVSEYSRAPGPLATVRRQAPRLHQLARVRRPIADAALHAAEQTPAAPPAPTAAWRRRRAARPRARPCRVSRTRRARSSSTTGGRTLPQHPPARARPSRNTRATARASGAISATITADSLGTLPQPQTRGHDGHGQEPRAPRGTTSLPLRPNQPLASLQLHNPDKTARTNARGDPSAAGSSSRSTSSSSSTAPTAGRRRSSRSGRRRRRRPPRRPPFDARRTHLHLANAQANFAMGRSARDAITARRRRPPAVSATADRGDLAGVDARLDDEEARDARRGRAGDVVLEGVADVETRGDQGPRPGNLSMGHAGAELTTSPERPVRVAERARHVQRHAVAVDRHLVRVAQSISRPSPRLAEQGR